MQLEYLAFPFHLPHADLAGELCGGQAVPLQGEGAVKGLLAATPNVVEGDLLGNEGSQGQGDEASLPGPQGMEAEVGNGSSVGGGGLRPRDGAVQASPSTWAEEEPVKDPSAERGKEEGTSLNV